MLVLLLLLFALHAVGHCALQFRPGPGPNAITVVNASSLSWDCLECVLSSDSLVAPALPQPVPAFMELPANGGAAPLVVQVYSCESIKVG